MDLEMRDNREVVITIERRVRRHLEERGIGSVLVAVSGGADSVALLRACASIASRFRLRLQAINCNFHLRGDESDRDSAFVEDLCSHLGVKLHSIDYDVVQYMEEHPGISTEMACRELRYADFFRICMEEGLERVAVAHNADDDIETMMLNLLRGSGTRGLRGMDIDNGRVVRPLLTTTRDEIESYLRILGQEFVTDSTNLTNEYRRNFIRHDILPLMEKRWNGARKSLMRTLSIMKEESAIVEGHYRSQIETNTDTGKRILRVYSEGVTPGTILRFIEPYGGNPRISQEIYESLSKPFRSREWRLDAAHKAILERDCLAVRNSCADEEEIRTEWSRMEPTDEAMREVRSNSDHCVIYLPRGKQHYRLRKPETGDRIAPLGMRGTRLVSDVISDARLDSAAKARVRVLERRSDGEVIWVTKLKRSRHDLIGPECESIHKLILNWDVDESAKQKPKQM